MAFFQEAPYWQRSDVNSEQSGCWRRACIHGARKSLLVLGFSRKAGTRDTEALSAELPRDFTRTGEQLQKHLRFVLKCSFPCTMQLVAQVFTGLTAKLHMFGSGRNS